MIHELLGQGIENAKTGKELAAVLNCDVRTVTQQIERERHNGQPICANCQGAAGYYLARDAAELQRYCNRLHRREGRIGKTRKHLLQTFRTMAEQEQGEKHGQGAESQ